MLPSDVAVVFYHGYSRRVKLNLSGFLPASEPSPETACTDVVV
jgi:hypothetical protein